MKLNKTIYWISTTLMSLLFLGSAAMYFGNYDRVQGFFTNLGFPTWLIYPLAVAKILGIAAIWTRVSGFLKELAYAGFLYDAMLALAAHINVADGEFAPAVAALILIPTSWVFDRKVFGPRVQPQPKVHHISSPASPSLAGAEAQQ